MRSRWAGKASFPVMVGAVVLSIALILVAVTFVQARRAATAGGKTVRPAHPDAAPQAANENEVKAARRKYWRELRYCEALRQFAGAETVCLTDFAVEYKDPFFCDEIPVTQRWQCSQWLARATLRSELCDGIPNPWTKWDCYLDTAAASADVRSCDRILNVEAQRRECERAGSGEVCAELNVENARQNYKACVAISQRNPSACEAVSSKPARLGCFRRLAVLKRDPALCKNMPDWGFDVRYQHLLYQCWKDVAVANARLEDCDRIWHEGLIRVSESGRNTRNDCRRLVEIRQVNAPCREEGPDLTCQGKVAAAKNDFDLCEPPTSYATYGGSARASYDICAITFAFRKNDGSRCYLISEASLRSACLELTGRPAPPVAGAYEKW